MIDLTGIARTVLSSAGYTVWTARVDTATLLFEDEALSGQVVAFDSISNLLQSWEATQDRFLRRFSRELRASKDKAWNVYSVFLTVDSIGPGIEAPTSIEEDFRGTRKIVGVGLRGNEDVTRTLLPLLPVQNLIGDLTVNPIEELRTRLSLLDATKDLVLGDATASEIATAILTER